MGNNEGGRPNEDCPSVISKNASSVVLGLLTVKFAVTTTSWKDATPVESVASVCEEDYTMKAVDECRD